MDPVRQLLVCGQLNIGVSWEDHWGGVGLMRNNLYLTELVNEAIYTLIQASLFTGGLTQDT